MVLFEKSVTDVKSPPMYNKFLLKSNTLAKILPFVVIGLFTYVLPNSELIILTFASYCANPLFGVVIDVNPPPKYNLLFMLSKANVFTYPFKLEDAIIPVYKLLLILQYPI